jgi:FkbM family methyltransferase
MEGNECYKFSTIRNFLYKTDGDPIRLAVDVGCNDGQVTLLIRHFFSDALIFALEPVSTYYNEACQNLQADAMIKVLPFAVTAEHLFADDLGSVPLSSPARLRVFLGLPPSGPGWKGGSRILRVGEIPEKIGYAPLHDRVTAISLDDLVHGLCALCGTDTVDYIKMDCEGCENSALGCASEQSLERIRFVSGEYHNLERFQLVIQKLSRTHNVNLVGDQWGSFFAERKGGSSEVLTPNPTHTVVWKCPDREVIAKVHGFREEFVDLEDRSSHAL